MKNVINWLKQEFQRLGAFLEKEEQFAVQHVLPFAIAWTEKIKDGLASGDATAIATAMDEFASSGIPLEVLGIAQRLTSKILSWELAVQSLVDNPTPEQIEAFGKLAASAIGVHTQTDRIWTNISGQLMQDIAAYVANGKKITLAQAVIDAEELYQDAKGFTAG